MKLAGTLKRDDPGLYFEWLGLVCHSLGKMVASWDANGFVHGVMNTDNFSVHGETLDYGPWDFIQWFDLDYVHNEDDTDGRYSFGKQRKAGRWNCERLGLAISPVFGVSEMSPPHEQQEAKRKLGEALDCYDAGYVQGYRQWMGRKLGIDITTVGVEASDECIKKTVDLLAESKVAYHDFFRQLSYGSASSVSALFAKSGHSAQYESWVKDTEGMRTQHPKNPAVIPTLELLNAIAAAAIDPEKDDALVDEGKVIQRALRWLTKSSSAIDAVEEKYFNSLLEAFKKKGGTDCGCG